MMVCVVPCDQPLADRVKHPKRFRPNYPNAEDESIPSFTVE